MSQIFTAEAGQILTSKVNSKPVRVDQLGVPRRAYVTPVKYNDNGIVRVGHSFWTTLHVAYWDAQ